LARYVKGKPADHAGHVSSIPGLKYRLDIVVEVGRTGPEAAFDSREAE
jgi:hypothetical protein